MLYALEQGPTEEAIIKQASRSKSPLPAKIVNAPELYLGLELFYTAFWDLNTCRSIGYGEGPIGWTSISEYCKVYEIEGEQREDVLYHVLRMDQAYLQHQAKKISKK